MKIAQWPDQDRLVWLAALQPTDPFEPEGGARASHSVMSNAKAVKGYGRWLTWLILTDVAALDEAPGRRITAERVKNYVADLREIGNGSQTILARLQELGEMAHVFAPTQDWSSIRRTASRVRANSTEPRDKRAKLVLSDELLMLGLALIEEAGAQTTRRRAALSCRDGLIIAILALRPLRRKNLAGLVIDDTLVHRGDGWSIQIDACDTKTNTPIETPWPDRLVQPLQAYLQTHRPVLANATGRWAAPLKGALWVSSDGSPMTQMALYDVIRKRTLERLGKPVNPHLFRDAAATSLAIHDPAHVRCAASLLGHRTFTTTERYYQHAQGIDANRRYNMVMDGLRANLGPAVSRSSSQVQLK